jgi:hypothetical protein
MISINVLIDEKDETRFLVFFRIDKELPLVGPGK